MLFRMGLYQTKSDFLSLLIGLSYSLSINQLFFEANILTETLSTFFIVLFLWLFIRMCHSNKSKILYHTSIAIVTSLAGLTRPSSLFLIPLYLLFFVSQRSGVTIKYLLSFMVPAAMIVFGWCFFNKVTVDYFGPTTLIGYHLTQHSGAFIELASDEEYSAIRDVYLKFRQRQIATTGTHSMTIWSAWPEMQKVTGLSYSELSRNLTRMSIKLFIRHPVLYLKSVSRAWVEFWKEPNYWKLDKVKSTYMRKLLDMTWWIQRRLLVGIELMFLFIALWEIYSVFILKHTGSKFNLLIISIVILASLFVALAGFAENARYAIPFQPLILYIVFVWTWRRFGLLAVPDREERVKKA